MASLKEIFEKMSQHPPTEGSDANDNFYGLIPGPLNLDGDWDVDGPNVIRKMGSRNMVEWMADAQRPQPVMAYALDDDATPRLEPRQTDSYPHPGLSLPRPVLTHDFRMSVTLNPAIAVGKTPLGERKWVSFTGGSWSASFGSGSVVPGGQDSQIIAADLSTRVETNYLLQTHDDPPAFIIAKTRGWRTGPPDILDALADPGRSNYIDPSFYKFRLFIDLETGDERYRENVNCGMWVGSGMRKGAEVVYDAYRVS